MVTRRFLMLSASAMSLLLTPLAAHSQTVLNVGAYPANPPFEYKNADGSFEGFEIDLITDIAKRVGAKLEISDYGFQALFAATTSKRIDVAVSSITITSERLKSQSFTQPYYDPTTDIAARKDSPIKTDADLKGKTIGVISGTVGEKWANANRAQYGITDIRSYNAKQDMLLDLIAGRVDAVVNDSMRFGLAKNPDLEVKYSMKSADRLGMMMTKDHPMLGPINDAIGAIKKDGTMAALYRKWFNQDPSPDSTTVNVVPLPTP
ncbi:ABC transporter substrate-binding protein [Neorhizobium tomejilense]|uniref:ABC transporter substrate-binding protein n=1 Tax=Neorhizobium tomejilense TaxID=2093828 RepID=UPI003ECE69B9